MDVAAAVSTASPIIYKLGAAWFFAEPTLATGKELGMPNGFAWYITGRGGVLGDPDPSVVAAALAFFNPDLIGKMWTAGTAVLPPREAARRYGECCAEFGRLTYGSFPGAARAAELGGKIVAAAPSIGRVLFAGWRAQPRPGDGPGDFQLTLQTLRELRGEAHIQACAVQGMGPLEAMLTQEGPEHAKQFGWAEPYPDVSALAPQRRNAEAATDALMAHVYERALSDAERSEFVSLLQQAVAFVDRAGA